ncbi:MULTISPECIES: polysaccharide biosynthesis protein [unclassified Priestia]|uniref:polysaccharide biosynthesis protein n=1 Tax=unclassified Priestia TaxID=2800374 RepID=UPI00366EFB23
MYKDKIILITGGTGSWGYELTKKLLVHSPKEIRILSRNEYVQVTMQRNFDYNAKIKFIIGDVRDYQSVEDASKNVHYVFHLAALKHVPICELQPEEALKTNVIGTENVIRASIKNKVKKVIDVSTDKAVDPINFYGMTKSFGEKLMLRANDYSEETKFVCIRGGNVLGTNGSVVPLFKNMIIEGKDITLTSKEMTRFFLTVSEAIDLLLKASAESIGGETYVMQMKACKILDLAEVLIEQLATKPVNIKEVGIRPGEKLHEILVSNHESPFTHHYHNQYYVILPSHSSLNLIKTYEKFRKVSFDEYSSNDLLMSKKDILEMLKSGGFIN